METKLQACLYDSSEVLAFEPLSLDFSAGFSSDEDFSLLSLVLLLEVRPCPEGER
jgi:hypothetical protein